MNIEDSKNAIRMLLLEYGNYGNSLASIGGADLKSNGKLADNIAAGGTKAYAQQYRTKYELLYPAVGAITQRLKKADKTIHVPISGRALAEFKELMNARQIRVAQDGLFKAPFGDKIRFYVKNGVVYICYLGADEKAADAKREKNLKRTFNNEDLLSGLT